MNPLTVYKGAYTQDGGRYLKIMFHWRDGMFTNKYVFSGMQIQNETTYTLERYSMIGDRSSVIYTKECYGELSEESLEEELKMWFKYERNLNAAFISGDIKCWNEMCLGDTFKTRSSADQEVVTEYRISQIITTDSRGGTRLITGHNEKSGEEWSFSVSNTDLPHNYFYTEGFYVESTSNKETKKI